MHCDSWLTSFSFFISAGLLNATGKYIVLLHIILSSTCKTQSSDYIMQYTDGVANLNVAAAYCSSISLFFDKDGMERYSYFINFYRIWIIPIHAPCLCNYMISYFSTTCDNIYYSFLLHHKQLEIFVQSESIRMWSSP
jgi:hypothetical protein